MKYYTEVSTCWQPKNAAQAAAQGYAITLDAALIDESYLAEFVKKILGTVETINKQFPRCGDLEFQFQNYDDLRGKSIFVDDPGHSPVFRVLFHEVRQELPNGEYNEQKKEREEMIAFGEFLTGLIYEAVDSKLDKFGETKFTPKVIAFGSYLTGRSIDDIRQMHADWVRDCSNSQATSNQ